MITQIVGSLFLVWAICGVANRLGNGIKGRWLESVDALHIGMTTSGKTGTPLDRPLRRPLTGARANQSFRSSCLNEGRRFRANLLGYG